MTVRGIAVSLLFAAAAPIAVAEELPLLKVEDVRPGMVGYGVTVFQGTKREQFTFVVRSVVPNFRAWPNVIVASLTGCPDCSESGQHMFEHHQIYGGMSGSPLIVVDPETGTKREMGGVAMAKDFATTNKVLITPLEYQFGMAAKLPPNNQPRSVAEPGDFTAICLVYGDRDSCYSGTITSRKDGRLFAMSHDVPVSDQEMFPYLETALPTFRIPVAEILESEQSPTKLSGARLEPIGSTVLHGKFGFVINEGALPKTVPVRLTITEVFEQPAVLTFNMAYQRNAPEDLKDKIDPIIFQLPGRYDGSRMKATIRLKKPVEKTIKLADSYSTGITRVRALLQYLIIQDRDNLDIEGVDLVYTPVEKIDYWVPVNFRVSDRGDRATLTVLARRLRDNETSEISEEVDMRPLNRYRQRKFLWKETRKQKHLFWWDGASLQDFILSRIPVRESLALLDEIQEREALYLVYGQPDFDLKASEGGTNGGWKKRLPEIRIVMKPTFGNEHFFLKTDRNGIDRGIEFKNQ
ncbi:MAG TPA: hypothetical protein VJ553_00210 [Candidatus Paceibacterota bacterium]|nr:hypothetical protein [Candidatus Paceibacterota bacterium]